MSPALGAAGSGASSVVSSRGGSPIRSVPWKAVLEALARALQLDDSERAHLLNLAQAADGSDALTRPLRRRTKDPGC